MKGWFVALGVSMLCHVTFIFPPVLEWLPFKQNILEKKDESAQVQILQFYPEDFAPFPLEESPPMSLREGSGWKKKKVRLFEDELTYATYIRDLIIKELRVPSLKGSSSKEEEVQVVFILDSKGTLQKLEVSPYLRSLSESMNQAAMDAVRRASLQFPPFPHFVKKSQQRFSFVLFINSN